MKKIRFIVILIFLPLYSFSQENIAWISHFGSSTPYYGVEQGRYIVTDSEGNIYVAGEFAQTILINGIKLISNGDKDIFLAKLNPLGKVLWMKNFGGIKGDWCGGICVDENSNIFLTGTFRDEMTIGGLVYAVIGGRDLHPGGYDFFLVKINKDGQIIWSKVFIGEGDNSTSALIKDNNGYIYMSGYYNKILKFDNYQLDGPTARSDLFITKLDSEGKVIWAKATKSNANNFVNSIANDNNGCLYLTGFMWDSVMFDNHLLISTGVMQAYISKMDVSTGEFLWAVGGGGKGWSEGNSIEVDNNNDVVVSGWYRKDLYFNDVFVTNGGNDNGPDDIFVTKFDEQGNLKWLKKIPCNLYSNSYDLTINRNNDIYLTGYFRGQILVGSNIYKSTVQSYYDIYVLKLNTEGVSEWFKSFGGDSPMNDIGYGITNFDSNIFLTGFYSSNSWFDDKFLNCNGASDIFIIKLSDTIKIIPDDIPGDFLIYPNPCSNTFFIMMNNDNSSYQFKLFNVTGKEMTIKSVIQLPLSEIDITNLPNGVYFLQIQDLNNKSFITRKIIKE